MPTDTIRPDAAPTATPPARTERSAALRLALPKGRMQAGVERLLADAGLALGGSDRDYRPPLDGFDTKRLKPRAIVQMLVSGSRDVGFCGLDWVRDEGADGLVELVDTGLDPVRVAIAAPARVAERLEGGAPDGVLRLASEFERLPQAWADARGLDVRFVRSFGATEVLPPEDADAICDVVQTGATLAANGLEIVDVIRTSSTRLYASPEAMRCDERRAVIERITDLLRSVIEARARLLVELNVAEDRLDEVLAVLPCMRRPTVSRLAGDGFAVRAAVPRTDFPELVGRIRSAGGTDLVVSEPRQVIP